MNQVYYWNRVCPTKFGTGASETIGDDAKAMGFSRVMLCTEQALMDFGIATKVQERLKDAGLEVFVYAACVPDAPSEVCDAGAAFARENNVDGIVAVGGGSTMDTAKAVGIILSMGGTTIADYYHIPEPEHKIRLIAIPTTSGTGSENSPGAVIRDAETGRKEIPVYKANLALVDPVLTYTVPASVTAATGLDVLAHAAEAITNRNFNAYGNIFAKEAIRLTMKYLKTACEKPDDVEAREKMAFASNLAGLAMAECGCSIGHSFSQTFGAMHHIPHGLGCAWGLPGVMIYSAKYGERKNLEEVADAMQVPYTDETDTMELAETMAKMFVDLMKELKIKSIRESGYSPEDCLAAADRFAHDGAFGNSPGNPGMNEIEAFIRYTYEAY